MEESIKLGTRWKCDTAKTTVAWEVVDARENEARDNTYYTLRCVANSSEDQNQGYKLGATIEVEHRWFEVRGVRVTEN